MGTLVGGAGRKSLVLSLVAVFVLIGAWAGPAGAAERALGGVEIMRLLSGSKWAANDPQTPAGPKATITILPSGELRFDTQRGFTDSGKWSVHGDRFCNQWQILRGGKKACVQVFERAPGEIRFQGNSGQTRELTLIERAVPDTGGDVATAGAPPPPAGTLQLPGRFFALVIGNDNYQHLPDLKTAVADARALAALLRERYGFPADNVRLLTDAGRAAVLDALATLRGELKPEDRLLIFYAGHGEVDPVTESGYWQPIDAEPDKRYTWIANDDIRREVRGLAAKHILIVADSCFAGTLMRGGPPASTGSGERFILEIDAHVSRKAITSGGDEPVADAGSSGHSIFSYYLLNFLRQNEDPYLSSFELFARIARAVTNNSRQTPRFGVVGDAGDEGGGDFTFVLAPRS